MSDSVHSAYRDFLERKIQLDGGHGVEVSAEAVHPLLSPHQRACVLWAVRGGRRALFEAFGLGKTLQQLEILRLTLAARTYVHGRALIVLPLGVRQEFVADARKIDVDVRFVRSDAELDGPGIYLTNYESVREGKLTPSLFDAASLDEAAVLRSYGSKTYQEFLPLFDTVPYRFVATATPDPNRYKELIHYAGFLGIMDTGQALTRWFQRDSQKANHLTLYPHKAEEFWLWVHSWAIFLQRPSDLGFADDGYDLPPLQIDYHEVPVDHATAGADRDGQSRMFREASLGVGEAARERRETLEPRIAQVMELVRATPAADQIVVWCDLNDEQQAIEAALEADGITCSSLVGTQDLDERERLLAQWRAKETRVFLSKPVMYGAGVNLQQCHTMIFAGIGFKFYEVIQAVHRIHRFLQTEPCDVHFVYAESERQILRALQAKWTRHDEQVERMSVLIREHGLNHLDLATSLRRAIGLERQETRGEGWVAVNNDCVDETARMPADSVDLVLTSIPFSNHYEYTPSLNDFGHTDGDAHFFSQMDFLTPELLRVLRPGRLACVHVKDRILFGNATGLGTPTVNPFHATCIAHYQRHGFAYMGMITVVTDVVRENNQTYRLGWSENCKDGTKMGVGSPEYILLLRKLPTDRSRAYADVPVRKEKAQYTRARWQVDAHAFWRSGGNRLLTVDELAQMGPDQLAKRYTAFSLETVYDHGEHVAIGEALDKRGVLPATFMAIAPGSHDPDVWHDVQRMRTLNGEQSRRGLQFHVCPLQFDIVDRLIARYTNAGDVVYDPFGGIGTVPYRAVLAGRRGIGVELSAEYFRDMARYLRAAEREVATPDLFAALTPATDETAPEPQEATG